MSSAIVAVLFFFCSSSLVVGHVQLRAPAASILPSPSPVTEALLQQAARATAGLSPGGPIAVQIDWLVQMGLTQRVESQLSGKCAESFKKHVVVSSALPKDFSAPQKAEDAAQCGSVGGGRVCRTRAVFSEDKAAHQERQSDTQITIWDLHTDWNWCLPSECADTGDLTRLAAFLRESIDDLAQPETAPHAVQTSLLLDCSASGGGVAEIGVDGRTVRSRATSPIAGFASLLAAALAMWTLA